MAGSVEQDQVHGPVADALVRLSFARPPGGQQGCQSRPHGWWAEILKGLL